jgi:hypothetical protein
MFMHLHLRGGRGGEVPKCQLSNNNTNYAAVYMSSERCADEKGGQIDICTITVCMHVGY